MKYFFGGMVLLFAFFMFACSDQRVREVKSLYAKTQETEDEDTKIGYANEYLFQLVYLEQELQSKSPKRLHEKLLLEGKSLASDMLAQYEALQEDIDFRISYATISNLLASYFFFAKSDVIKASEYSQEAIFLFDALVEDYPDNPVIRGYRFINYSYFPDILEKSQYLAIDFTFLQHYIENHSEFTEFEKDFFQIVLDRVLSYEQEKKNGDFSEEGIILLQEKISLIHIDHPSYHVSYYKDLHG